MVMGIIMPEMGGIEAFDIIRAKNPTLKAIFCSGYSMNSFAQEFLERGSAGFMQKPFKVLRMSQMVRDIQDA